jgi:hypothetical protein
MLNAAVVSTSEVFTAPAFRHDSNKDILHCLSIIFGYISSNTTYATSE